MSSLLTICMQFNLSIIQVSEHVYKNSNPDVVVNIDKLKHSIGDCIIVASDIIKKTREYNGVYSMYSKLYYIIDDTEDNDLLLSIFNTAKTEYGCVRIDVYEPSKNTTDCISTIYGGEELGVKNESSKWI